jgi:hypothetical protein
MHKGRVHFAAAVDKQQPRRVSALSNDIYISLSCASVVRSRAGCQAAKAVSESANTEYKLRASCEMHCNGGQWQEEPSEEAQYGVPPSVRMVCLVFPSPPPLPPPSGDSTKYTGVGREPCSQHGCLSHQGQKG